MQLLGTHYRDLLLWIRHLTRQTHRRGKSVRGEHIAAQGAAYVIEGMIMIDPHLRNAILSAPLATELILGLWTNAPEEPDNCPIVHNLTRLLLHTVGRSNILTLLGTPESIVLGLVPTLRRRFRHLLKPDQRSSDWFMRRLDYLSGVAVLLLNPENGFPEYLIQPLQSPGFISDFFQILNVALRDDTSSVSVTQMVNLAEIGFLLVLAPFHVRTCLSRNPIRLAKAALEGGCYFVAVKALAMLSGLGVPGVDRPHSTLPDLIREMAAYGVFHEVVPSLLRAYSSVPSSMVEMASKEEAFSQVWDTITGWLLGQFSGMSTMGSAQQGRFRLGVLTENMCSNSKVSCMSCMSRLV